MNVYDFDGTIYRGDSTLHFYWYCLQCQPTLARYLPGQVLGLLRCGVGAGGKDAAKSAFFAFVRGVRDLPGRVQAFWLTHEANMATWYLMQRQAQDVVVSASPAWLLQPLCDRLGVKLIATEVDGRSGRLLGPNCHGAQKVARFAAQYPCAQVGAFYSDSRSDAPMAGLAAKAYLVRGGMPAPWPGMPQGW